MSSAEEDHSKTPETVIGNVKKEVTDEEHTIDPESFATKCQISTNSNKIASPTDMCYENIIDPETFSRKCQISSNSDKIKSSSDASSDSDSTYKSVDSNIKREFDSIGEEHDIKLECRQDRSLSKKARVHDKYTHPCVPKINCPEKIIFCIDMSSELEELPFRKNDGSQHSALSMVKRTIELFVHNKNFIDKKHEYSLMVLYESATWVREFTNDILELIDSLEDLNETQPCISCDFASIVQLILEKFELTVPKSLLPVPYDIRVVLIYGRSNCMFHFSEERFRDAFMTYPFLFLDILYMHEPPSEHNKSKAIYDALCDLDEMNKSYIFEVTRNVTKLHNCMAKFLAHPLQRAAQKDTFYKIQDIVS